MKVFLETQRFNQWWFRLLLLLAGSISIVTIVMSYQSIQEEPMAFWISLFSGLLTLAITISLLFTVKLETKIDELGIHYNFWPFKSKSIPWADIIKCSVIKYSPLVDYGGWGYKLGLFRKKGPAMSVRGNIGIQIVFKSGKRLLIGTQKRDDLEKVLENYAHKIKPYED